MSSTERRFDQLKPVINTRFRKEGLPSLDSFSAGVAQKADLVGRRLRQIALETPVPNTEPIAKKIAFLKTPENTPKILTFKKESKKTLTQKEVRREDKDLSRLMERVDRAVSVMRRSGCKCGYEARQNPNAFGCRSRFCVKNRDSGQLNNIRFMRAALRRGVQRVSHARQGVTNSENVRDRTIARRAPAKAAA